MLRITVLFVSFFVVVWGAPDPRIIGGETTTIQQYPFMVSMLYNMGSGSRFFQFCGGTILTPTAILSAAHCYINFWGNVMDVSLWRARVGSTLSESDGTLNEIQRFILHDFDYETSNNDVAVVRTATPIQYVQGLVENGRIAGPNYFVPDDTPLWIVGWGRTDYYDGSSAVLRHAQVRYINNDICSSAYAPDSTYPAVTDRMMCAGDLARRGVCSGDSGGPLLHQGVVMGIVSWSESRCNTTYPSVFTRVSAFTDWIVAASVQTV